MVPTAAPFLDLVPQLDFVKCDLDSDDLIGMDLERFTGGDKLDELYGFDVFAGDPVVEVPDAAQAATVLGLKLLGALLAGFADGEHLVPVHLLRHGIPVPELSHVRLGCSRHRDESPRSVTEMSHRNQSPRSRPNPPASESGAEIGMACTRKLKV